MGTMAEKAKTQKYKVPPQEIESEKALLGSIMLKPDTLNEIIDIVSPDSFYVETSKLSHGFKRDGFAFAP